MVDIALETRIRAPIERVFDLSRSIDVHLDSTSSTGERAIAGTTTGLIGLGENVTWSAVHFCIRQKLTVEIVEFERPRLFADQMTAGAFKSMHHRHTFEACGDETIMQDHFAFEAPLGILGIIAEKLVLASYMRRFLEIRNARLKGLVEGDEWSRFLTE